MEPDDLPKKPPLVIVGEPLDLMSVAELEQRVQALESEIVRTRVMITSKQNSRSAADAFFRS